MAKPRIKTYKNGATLIYQQDPNIDGYKVDISFKGGAQLDGKYPGISHLVEHLLFRKENIQDTNEYMNKLLCDCLNVGAYTSPYNIVLNFASTNGHIEEFLDLFVERFKYTNFTKEQIKREVDVIKQEMGMHGKRMPTFTQTNNPLINSLQINHSPQLGIDALGTEQSLKKITPEVVADYMKKYFNSDNLIVSVVSNKPFNEVEKLINNHVVSSFKKAKKDEHNAQLPVPVFYNPQNVVLLQPDNSSSTIRLEFLIRERTLPGGDPELEAVYNSFESNLLGELGAILYKKFRIEESLCYVCSTNFLDLGTSKFKIFDFNTNKAKLNRVIKKFCALVKEIGENGFNKEDFEAIRKSIVEANESKLFSSSRPNSNSNLENYMRNFPILDNDKINEYYKTIKFEDFNEYIKKIYSKGNISMHVSGDFDSRKCYNLIEIEEMVGNTTHSKLKPQFNVSKREAAGIDLSDEELEQWKVVAEALKVAEQANQSVIDNNEDGLCDELEDDEDDDEDYEDLDDDEYDAYEKEFKDENNLEG